MGRKRRRLIYCWVRGQTFLPRILREGVVLRKEFFFKKRNTFSGLFGRNEGRRRRRRRRRRLIASRCLMTYGSQKSDLCGILQRRGDSFLKSAPKRAIFHCLKMPDLLSYRFLRSQSAANFKESKTSQHFRKPSSSSRHHRSMHLFSFSHAEGRGGEERRRR